MSDDIMIIQGVKARLNENGGVELNLEHVARGLGFTQKKGNAEYVRWERVSGYLDEFSFPASGENNGIPNFIPENIFYKLCFKAESETARTFQDLVTDVILPTIRKTGKYETRPNFNSDKTKRLEIQEKNARIRASQTYLRIADNPALPDAYREVMLTYASRELSGQELLPLPRTTEKTYTATEIAKECGVSANMIGKIANANNLKTSEFGIEVWDKSPYSAKQVPSWRYNENGRRKLKELVPIKAAN